MKKTIIKTALFTVLALICCLFLSVFSIFAFAPKLSAKITYDLGMKKMSTSCYERVYKKTGDLEDLIMVIDSAVYAEDKETIAQYGVMLFDTYGNTSEFKNYCDVCDVDVQEGGYTTYDYYANTVFMALYSQGQKEKAVEFAIVNLKKYTDRSALKRAVVLANPTNDKELGLLLVKGYKRLRPTIDISLFNDFREELIAYKDADGNSVYKF
ncbi:MAG: hypothetical protein IKA99_07705 [Clostridia bacterium]|nr:hypothetical protein [Clostridia bacterium]